MRKYTREQLIFYLHKFNSSNKRSPTIKDFRADKKVPSPSTYLSRFGTWNKSLSVAGLKINNSNWSKKELIQNLKQLAKELNRVPKAKDLAGKDWCASYSTYRNNFRSWKNALAKAGLSKGYRKLKEYLR